MVVGYMAQLYPNLSYGSLSNGRVLTLTFLRSGIQNDGHAVSVQMQQMRLISGLFTNRALSKGRNSGYEVGTHY